MATVQQLTRVMPGRPTPMVGPNLTIRTFLGPEDVPIWLEIRRQAFARQTLGVRAWSERDFSAEFLERSGWRPELLWFAEWQDSPSRVTPAGTIGVAWRRLPPHGQPALHWLAVAPAFRRRGIGSALVATAEAACWDLGCRQVWLETHTAWGEAAALYERLGYQGIDR